MTAGYNNTEDTLRAQFGSSTEQDGLEDTTGGKDIGGRGWCEAQQEYRPNLKVLVGAPQFQNPGYVESQFEETDEDYRQNCFITTQ